MQVDWRKMLREEQAKIPQKMFRVFPIQAYSLLQERLNQREKELANKAGEL